MALGGLFELFEMKFLEPAIVPVFELVFGSALEEAFKKLPPFPILVKEFYKFQILLNGPFCIIDVGSEVSYVMLPQLFGCAI